VLASGKERWGRGEWRSGCFFLALYLSRTIYVISPGNHARFITRRSVRRDHFVTVSFVWPDDVFQDNQETWYDAQHWVSCSSLCWGPTITVPAVTIGQASPNRPLPPCVLCKRPILQLMGPGGASWSDLGPLVNWSWPRRQKIGEGMTGQHRGTRGIGAKGAVNHA